ncbi:MAG TPA: response regulator [Rhodocyclaceae bacterium]|nr:response regulator [Rhodocyclaceae bacterium]
MSQADSGSIVIVDDNPNNLEVLEGMLVQAGYKVRPALNGAVALRAIELNPPDLVLLDIRMPGMDGYETCRRIKAQEQLRDVPVIFVSALSDTEDKVEAFEVGGVDYVSKPFQRAEVLARVRSHIQLRRMQVNLERLVEERTSELRSAYEALSTREREFRTLAENQPDYIVRYDKDGRKVYFNTAMAQIFGPHAAAYIGLRYDESLSEDDRAMTTGEYADAIRRALEQGQDSELEMKGISSTGEPRFYSVRVVCERDAKGTLEGVLAVARDITHIVEAERRLQQLSSQLRRLSARQEVVREEERRHIAREIHDELGQQLTALRLKVNLIKLQYSAAEPTVCKAVTDLLVMVDRTIQVARNVSTALRPAALDIGIAAALDWLATEFQESSGIACKLGPIPSGMHLDEDRAVVVFRIAQESLTNVARHSRAQKVRITLEEQQGNHVLEIVDDGIGFDPNAVPPQKFGLIGMRERALAVDGEIQVESSPGKGTRVRVVVPVNSSESVVA